VPLTALEWSLDHPKSVTNGDEERSMPLDFPFLLDGKTEVTVSGTNCSTDPSIELPFLCDLSFESKELNANHINALFNVFPIFNFATSESSPVVEEAMSLYFSKSNFFSFVLQSNICAEFSEQTKISKIQFFQV